MAYVAADGPPSIDATHAWAPLAGTAPPVLNDRGGDPPVPPWIKVIRIDGWLALAELLENSDPVTYGIGEKPYPTRKIGRTVVYVCEARAKTRETLARTVFTAMEGFNRSTSELGVMTVTPYPAPGGVVWTFGGRVQQALPDAAFSYFPLRRLPFRHGFTVSMRLHNPRFYQGATAYLG